jgi:hypothetical protein
LICQVFDGIKRDPIVSDFNFNEFMIQIDDDGYLMIRPAVREPIGDNVRKDLLESQANR